MPTRLWRKWFCAFSPDSLTFIALPQGVAAGFDGNQPFFTRSSCSKISLIVQKEENAKNAQQT